MDEDQEDQIDEMFGVLLDTHKTLREGLVEIGFSDECYDSAKIMAQLKEYGLIKCKECGYWTIDDMDSDGICFMCKEGAGGDPSANWHYDDDTETWEDDYDEYGEEE